MLNSTQPISYHPQTNSIIDRDTHRPHRNHVIDQLRRNRQSLNINYGTINQEDSLDFNAEGEILRPMNQQFNDIRKAEKIKYVQSNGCSSSFGVIDHNNYTTPENEQNDGQLVQMEKDTLDLRRELQDTIASKKQADNRILA